MKKTGIKDRMAFWLLCAILAAGGLNGCGRKYEQKPLPGETSSAIEEAPDYRESGETLSETQPQPETKEEKEAGFLEEDFPLQLIFASGAGAWGTGVNLNQDGTFEGRYDDSEMGDQGEGYPHGSHYECVFSGKFGDIKRVDDHTYSMVLEEIHTEKPEGEEWIEDQIRYVAAGPFGMEKGTEFYLYTPTTPIEELSQDFLNWWPDRYLLNEGTVEVLGCYGLYNKEMEYGFFTHE